MGYIRQYRGLSRCVYVVALSKLIQTIGAFIWPLFTVVLKTKLDLEADVIALFVSVSVMSGFAGSVIGGYVSDLLGRKRTIIAFELLASLSFLAVLLVNSNIQIAILLSTGIFFFSMSGPAHNSLLANVTKTEDKEVAYSLHMQVTKIGVILGPVLGGLLLVNYFELFIVLDVITTILGLVLLATMVKEKKDKVGINPFEITMDHSVWSLIKERPFILYYALLSMFTAVIYGQMDYTLPIYIMDTVNNGEVVFAYLYSFNGVIIVGLTATITYLLRRQSSAAKIFIGLGIYTIALYINVFVTEAFHFFIMMFVFSIGELILSIGMGPKLSRMVPVNMYGKVTSFVQIFYVFGHLIATSVPALLLVNGVTYVELWSIIGAFSFIGTVILFYVRDSNKELLGLLDSYDKNR